MIEPQYNDGDIVLLRFTNLTRTGGKSFYLCYFKHSWIGITLPVCRLESNVGGELHGITATSVFLFNLETKQHK
jgi:hypothetical protein